MSSTRRVRVRPVRVSSPPQSGQAGSWCDLVVVDRVRVGGVRHRGGRVAAPRFLRRGVAGGLAYGGTDPEGVWAPLAGAGSSATAVLSWRRRKMAAARSRGRTASAWSGVRVPERNAATKAASRVGATGVMPAILDNPPKSGRPVQKAEGLRQPIRRPNCNRSTSHPLLEGTVTCWNASSMFQP